MGIALSPAQTDRVRALIEASEGGLYRSDDGGAKWEKTCDDEALRVRPWYYTHRFADPQDAETVWLLDYDALKSTDGGKNFVAVATPHGDNHDLWIDPRHPQRMIEGNDGGACVSFNVGKAWSTLYNQPTAQIYHAIVDHQTPYRVYGSQQDNTAISLPSISTRGAITPIDWFEPGGGESGYIAIKPDDPSIVVGARSAAARRAAASSITIAAPIKNASSRFGPNKRGWALARMNSNIVCIGRIRFSFRATTRMCCTSRSIACSACAIKARPGKSPAQTSPATMRKNCSPPAVRSLWTTPARNSIAPSSRSSNRRTNAMCCGRGRTTA